MNSTVKGVLLVVVIAACLGFVGYRMFGGSGGGAASPTPKAEHDLYCLNCKKHYSEVMEAKDYAPLLMQGINASQKHTCPTCGKQAVVAAIKCSACGEWVPSPGMQGVGRPVMNGPRGPRGPVGPTCPKCGKPLQMPKLGSPPPAAE